VNYLLRSEEEVDSVQEQNWLDFRPLCFFIILSLDTGTQIRIVPSSLNSYSISIYDSHLHNYVNVSHLSTEIMGCLTAS